MIVFDYSVVDLLRIMGPRKKPVVSPQPTKGSLSTYTRREPLHHDDNVGYDEDDDDDIDHTKDDNDLVGPEEEEENTSLEEFDEVEVKVGSRRI